MVIFTFLRIHHFLKVIANIVCLVLYGLIILGAIENGEKKNVFKVEYFGYEEAFDDDRRNVSHFVFLAVISVFFFVMDRQHEYMHRLDYQVSGEFSHHVLVFDYHISVEAPA